MIICGPGTINKSQRGFTLIEVLMAIAVTAIIAVFVTVSIFQIVNVNSKSNSRLIAVEEVENAINWITKDAQMAQFSQFSETGTQPLPVNLAWANEYDYPPTSVSVIYRINGNQLLRDYSINGEPPTTTVVVSDIDPDPLATNWSFSWSPSSERGALTFQISVTVGGSKPVTETRSFTVVSRSVTNIT
jgi:prepilin-type N-terminal cleavage/methylation domain-containing protein